MNHDAYRTARCPLAFVLVTAALGLGSASCTGDDSANHVISQAVVPDDVLLFDDFESVSAGAAPAVMTGVFKGQAWCKYDDHTLDRPDGGPPDAAAPEGQLVVATEALSEADSHLTINGAMSTHAMHMYGGIFRDWGSGVGGGNFAGGAPYNLSEYTGIIFWAKMGSTSASSSMTVSLGTLNDQPREGGICHDPETPGKHDRCNDSFHIDVTLRPYWNLYVIAFSDLVQAGWGYKPLGGFDKNSPSASPLVTRGSRPREARPSTSGSTTSPCSNRQSGNHPREGHLQRGVPRLHFGGFYRPSE